MVGRALKQFTECCHVVPSSTPLTLSLSRRGSIYCYNPSCRPQYLPLNLFFFHCSICSMFVQRVAKGRICLAFPPLHFIYFIFVEPSYYHVTSKVRLPIKWTRKTWKRMCNGSLQSNNNSLYY